MFSNIFKKCCNIFVKCWQKIVDETNVDKKIGDETNVAKKIVDETNISLKCCNISEKC
jgi:hypothetical protein